MKVGALNRKLKDWVLGPIVSGTDIVDNIEQYRKRFLINFILIVGGIFLACLTTVSFYQRYLLLGAVDLIILGFVAILFIRLRGRTDTRPLEIVGTTGIGLFYSFLIAYGGVNKTAFMWAFTYPLIALSLLGPRLGSLMSFILLGMAGTVFAVGPHIPILAIYNTDIIIRFISAYLTIYFIALVMERTRGYVQSRLKLSNRKLKKAFDKVQEKTTALCTSNRELQKEVEERQRIEKALSDSENFLDNIIESIQDGISVLEPDLTIRHVNSVMTHWYRENAPLIGKKCYETYHNSFAPCDMCPTLRCLTSGETEVEIVSGPSGSPVEWLELFSYPITDQESGKITGVVEFVRDITERKRIERQLSQAQRMDSIGRLAGGVAHDFNNILMGVQGRVSLMFSESGLENSIKEHLQSIELYVHKATELTRQLLGFARGGKYEIKPTDINRLIDENIDLFSRTRKELLVKKELESQIWTAEVDEGQISQVLLNLFVNAWEAMPNSGELTIKTSNTNCNFSAGSHTGKGDSKFVSIAITDTGIGMDTETIERIYDPFYTTKEMGSGTGLGLSSVYGIIRNHNGRIQVKSKPGKGTTFTIFLPASEKEIIQEEKKPEKMLTGSETILLVDDEKMVLDVSSRLLQKLGYDVLTAENGIKAVETYETYRGQIGCIILDMIMPVQNGGETYDRLKQLNPGIKVLLSSGYSLDNQAKEIMRRGCSGFIQKPFTIKELSEKVRNVLCAN